MPGAGDDGQAADEATRGVDESLDLARRSGWNAFLPWPESLRAGIDLANNDLDRAEDRLDHAFAMSCHVGDPCWEGISARGLDLLRAIRGDVDGALNTLRDARLRSTRLPDAYLWVDAYTLDAMCALATRHRLGERQHWAVELSNLAARSGMRELVVRALVHRAALGDGENLDVAASLAAGIDNPVIARLIAASSVPTRYQPSTRPRPPHAR